MPDLPSNDMTLEASMAKQRLRTFDDLLAKFQAARPVGSDDVVGAVRALLEDVREAHERGDVANLDRVDLLVPNAAGELRLGACPVGQPALNARQLEAIQRPQSQAVEIVRQFGVDEAGGQIAVSDRSIAEPGQMPSTPMFYRNYGSWERAVGHHDALTDIFHLGLVMASFATGLDFRDAAQFQTFVQNRSNLIKLNPRLHAVLARAISDMTEPLRANRAADLPALIDLIDDYRSVEVDDARNRERDLETVGDPQARRLRLQEFFRNRLFEVTRRNKLLYYADRHGVDLTRGSFPIMLDYKTLKTRQLLMTGPDLLTRLAQLHDRGQPVGELDLRRWLQCVDYPFLAPSLDKIRSAARKDQRELGFNQLRLVLAMLRWNDDEKGERINTPLVMLPVSLKKQSGTPDGFSLVIEGPVAEAEINPVLRYILAERFKVKLPETLDLRNLDALQALRATLERDVRRVKPGVAIALIERPRVQLIQKTIKRQLDDHRRRQKRAGQQLKDWRGVAYSYATDTYQPLGLELFDRFVRPKPAPGREFANGKIAAIDSGMKDGLSGPAVTAETYAFEGTEHGDPLNWEIDLSAVTLANFNTRKMSLVRDYEVLLDGFSGQHANYGRLFEHGARPALAAIEKPSHSQRNFVLPSDPSQDEAILRAATGESYVIQGPPGTGKSQTIVNLLADLAARGKSVLFVCEKRVALDVVHNRLKEAGLGDLACLVHDAREDRLEFIADLKVLYETWSNSRGSRTIRDKREKLAAEIDALAAKLGEFSEAMQLPAAASGTVRALMGRAIADRILPSPLSNRDRERIPSWDAFLAGETPLRNVERLVETAGQERSAITALMRVLRTAFVSEPRPIAFLEGLLPEVEDALTLLDRLSAAAVPGSNKTVTMRTLDTQSALAARIRVLAEIGKLNLLDPLDPEAARLQKQLQILGSLDATLAGVEASNRPWTRKPLPPETETALTLARQKEGTFWSFLSSDWRQLKRMVAGQYNDQVTSYVALLERLAAEHAARAARNDHDSRIKQAFGLDDVAEVRTAVEPHWHGEARVPPDEKALIDACLREPQVKSRHIMQLAADTSRLNRARQSMDKIFQGYDSATSTELADRLATLSGIKEQAVDLARRLKTLENGAPEMAQAWRELPYDLEHFRAAALHTSIARALETAPEAQHLTAGELQAVAEDLGGKLEALRDLNAKRTLEEQRQRFRQHGSAKNQAYDRGREFLEHQFSLQRPSAAMRDFLAGDPSRVVADLKPIWMMSPLSVADTLPLDDKLFDVVVFDEASQIPIEDAIPTLYRAPQSIIVGDEMQLPPPSYFSKRLETDGEALPDYIAFGMQAESLLDKAIVALPSTRLDWHYRSRHEGLIGFCNQAFYAGQLKTIPSRQLLQPSPPIDTAQAIPMKQLAALVLDRPLSFHKITGGTFANQQNLKEAAYIAELVRALLSQGDSKSIGIVAFSQPQQAAIEEALERLAASNQTFRTRLDEAMAAEHEELFVKNLENVQGDERDIMIVSVAYGPGTSGRMIMNFGPINQEGGEKRLNVIFSRAKHHMVLVASIDPAQITNDYNKGANALKRYMMYAAAASTGDTGGMRVALQGFPGAEHIDLMTQQPDALADAIADAQRGSGRDVVRALGQSTARCDVAVRDPASPMFKTAILTDNEAHYEIADVVDRYVTYPSLLRSSGWEVQFALAKDWLAAQAQTAASAAPATAHMPAKDLT